MPKQLFFGASPCQFNNAPQTMLERIHSKIFQSGHVLVFDDDDNDAHHYADGNDGADDQQHSDDDEDDGDVFVSKNVGV